MVAQLELNSPWMVMKVVSMVVGSAATSWSSNKLKSAHCSFEVRRQEGVRVI